MSQESPPSATSDVPIPTNADIPSSPPTLHGNKEYPIKPRLGKAEKRLLAEAKRKEYWKQKRTDEKANRKRKREEMIAAIKAGGGDPRKELADGKDTEKHRLKRRKMSEIEFAKQRIVIDMGFDEMMTIKEVRSLVSQLTQLYACNRLVEHPLQVIVTEFSGRLKEHLESLDGFDNWVGIRCEQQNYLDLFAAEKERLVYLTADSTETIHSLDENDIYIIGGIVDKNRHKGICLAKAQEQGLRTARLPIDAYMDLKTRKVLTVNQVYEILLKWTVEKDWAKAFEAIVPKRKGGSVLPSADDDLPNSAPESPSPSPGANSEPTSPPAPAANSSPADVKEEPL